MKALTAKRGKGYWPKARPMPSPSASCLSPIPICYALPGQGAAQCLGHGDFLFGGGAGYTDYPAIETQAAAIMPSS